LTIHASPFDARVDRAIIRIAGAIVDGFAKVGGATARL